MKKQLPFRMIFNLVLIAIIAISVVATGFVSIKEFRSNRIPEIYSDKQITKIIKDKYSDFEFNEDDNWNVKTNLADDNKSFTADTDIVCTKDLCRIHYSVQLTFKLVDGNWKLENLPSEIAFVQNEWLFENSIWSVTATNGIKYEVSFMTNQEAKLCVKESLNSVPSDEAPVNVLDEEEEESVSDEEGNDDSEDNANNTDDDLEDSDNENIDLDEEETNKIVTCYLSESDDGTFLEGTFELSYDKTMLLVVTEDSVKLTLNNKDGELTLMKE